MGKGLKKLESKSSKKRKKLAVQEPGWDKIFAFGLTMYALAKGLASVEMLPGIAPDMFAVLGIAWAMARYLLATKSSKKIKKSPKKKGKKKRQEKSTSDVHEESKVKPAKKMAPEKKIGPDSRTFLRRDKVLVVGNNEVDRKRETAAGSTLQSRSESRNPGLGRNRKMKTDGQQGNQQQVKPRKNSNSQPDLKALDDLKQARKGTQAHPEPLSDNTAARTESESNAADSNGIRALTKKKDQSQRNLSEGKRDSDAEHESSKSDDLGTNSFATSLAEHAANKRKSFEDRKTKDRQGNDDQSNIDQQKATTGKADTVEELNEEPKRKSMDKRKSTERRSSTARRKSTDRHSSKRLSKSGDAVGIPEPTLEEVENQERGSSKERQSVKRLSKKDLDGKKLERTPPELPPRNPRKAGASFDSDSDGSFSNMDLGKRKPKLPKRTSPAEKRDSRVLHRQTSQRSNANHASEVDTENEPLGGSQKRLSIVERLFKKVTSPKGRKSHSRKSTGQMSSSTEK